MSAQALVQSPFNGQILPGTIDAGQSASQFVGQTAGQAVVDATQKVGDPVVDAIQHAGQSLPIGQDAASQVIQQLDGLMQQGAVSAAQALQYLQGLLY